MNMEECAWTKRRDREIDFNAVLSSRGRFWHGFEAYLYDATAGYSEHFFANHCVSMHVSEPALTAIRCDGASFHAVQKAGDVKIVPAGYSRIWQTSGQTRKLVVLLAPWFVDEVARAMGFDPGQISIVPQLHLNDKRIEYLGWAILAELEANEPVGRIYANSLGTAMAAHVLQNYARPSESRVATGLPKRRLQKIVDYVHENISHDLSLSELAAVASMSSSHLKVLFKQSTGMPVHQYVIQARLQHALQLIVETSLPLAEIALLSGFASQSHLARCFRPVYGVTPAELRRESIR